MNPIFGALGLVPRFTPVTIACSSSTTSSTPSIRNSSASKEASSNWPGEEGRDAE
nr:hypothetical protein [Sinorhizobium medicae]